MLIKLTALNFWVTLYFSLPVGTGTHAIEGISSPRIIHREYCPGEHCSPRRPLGACAGAPYCANVTLGLSVPHRQGAPGSHLPTRYKTHKKKNPNTSPEACHTRMQPSPVNRDRGSLPPVYDHLLKNS